MFQIIINDIKYMRTENAIYISIHVILDPRIRDQKEAANLLDLFNILISNKIGFDGMKFFNETSSDSALLSWISDFSRKICFIK